MRKNVTREEIVRAFSGSVEYPIFYKGDYETIEGCLRYTVYFNYEMILSLKILRIYESLFGTNNIVVHYHKDMISVVIKPEGVPI